MQGLPRTRCAGTGWVKPPAPPNDGSSVCRSTSYIPSRRTGISYPGTGRFEKFSAVYSRSGASASRLSRQYANTACPARLVSIQEKLSAL